MKKELGIILFLFVLAFFFIKGIFYVFYIPPWEAPDEPGHVSYVFYLFHNHKIPDTTMQPGILHAIDSSWTHQRGNLSANLQKQNIKANDLINRNGYKKESSVSNILEYPPLYYLYLLPLFITSLHFSSYITFIALRLGSLLLGTISLIFSYKIVKLIFPKIKYFPHFVIFLLTLDPMFTFMHSVVNNDSMVIAFFLMSIYFMIKFIISPKEVNLVRILLIGFFVGLASFVKPQLVILMPIYFTSLFIPPLKKFGIKTYLVIFTNTITLPILWYAYKYLQQGNSSLTYAFISKSNHSFNFLQYPIFFIKTKQPIGIFMSFWGFFGWLNVAMPKYIYGLFGFVFIVGIIGWFLKRSKNYFSEKQKHIFIFFLIIMILYTSFIFLYDILYFVKGGGFGIQGRYFLPLLPLLLIFVLQGFMFYGKKLKVFFLMLSISIFILSQIYMYTTISIFYYKGYYMVSPLTNTYIK